MSASMFDRVSTLEAQGAAQAATIAALVGRITALQAALAVPRAVSMAHIAKDAAAAHGITARQIRSSSQARCISWPRQVAMSKMREQGFSFEAIAEFWGMDHTTVMHGIKAAKGRESAKIQAVAACGQGADVPQMERAAKVLKHPRGSNRHRTVEGFKMQADASQYIIFACYRNPEQIGGALRI